MFQLLTVKIRAGTTSIVTWVILNVSDTSGTIT